MTARVASSVVLIDLRAVLEASKSWLASMGLNWVQPILHLAECVHWNWSDDLAEG